MIQVEALPPPPQIDPRVYACMLVRSMRVVRAFGRFYPPVPYPPALPPRLTPPLYPPPYPSPRAPPPIYPPSPEPPPRNPPPPPPSPALPPLPMQLAHPPIRLACTVDPAQSSPLGGGGAPMERPAGGG